MAYSTQEAVSDGSLVLLDVIKKAANGNAKAAEHLTKYGIESRGMDKLKNAVSPLFSVLPGWKMLQHLED